MVINNPICSGCGKQGTDLIYEKEKDSWLCDNCSNKVIDTPRVLKEYVKSRNKIINSTNRLMSSLKAELIKLDLVDQKYVFNDFNKELFLNRTDLIHSFAEDITKAFEKNLGEETLLPSVIK